MIVIYILKRNPYTFGVRIFLFISYKILNVSHNKINTIQGDFIMLNNIMVYVQFAITIIIGLYFLTMLKGQYSSKNCLNKDSTVEMEKLRKMNKVSLTEPLTEKTRPKNIADVIGQEDGIKALKIALCGKNPQHVLIYGPPGIGKTAASRVVLKEAIKNPESPFNDKSKFIEIDATTIQFDERSIADPLIGSVHDPIYQGAGAYGPAGVPQPKPGAVTKAHGGVLFIDEIGELQGLELNKLLKVLEDRRVYFDSSYYSSSNKEIPRHIHEIFENGLPADFRLIGATTRSPEEIPPALRSRCVEIYFKQLNKKEIIKIIKNAFKENNMESDECVQSFISDYAKNGRDAVKIVQTASGIALMERRCKVELSDVEWVVKTGRFMPVYEKKVVSETRCGRVYGLAVGSEGKGFVLDIEVIAKKVYDKSGKITLTGVIEEQEFKTNGQKLKKRSSIVASVNNVLTALYSLYGIEKENYNIHINFPNCVPVDGPSAGIAIMTAVYSAIFDVPVDSMIALTGEISIFGNVLPVGEISAKVSAAEEAGIKKVIVPYDNYKEINFDKNYVEIIPAGSFKDVIMLFFGNGIETKTIEKHKISENINTISALGVDIFKEK